MKNFGKFFQTPIVFAFALGVATPAVAATDEETLVTTSAAIAEAQRLAIRDSAFRIDRDRQSLKNAAARWEAAFVAVSAVDLAQTLSCLDAGRCVEMNPLLGKRPKATTLIAGKLLVTGVHFAAFRYANARDPKAALRFAQFGVVTQGAVVALNMRFTF